ncbi:MAG: TFIIB-type zinc ribbon-containing protein [Clostridiales bacterium]|jgi:DNA-directed RNA polymerase subunit RPC12/RpoP|nr:TFIIB-type zinc ribbon-containing protein [Clostridiales bacterium]
MSEYGQTQQEVRQDVDVFKCKNCGNDLTFEPKSGKLACEHCGTVEDIHVERFVEQRPVDFSLDTQVRWGAETRTFKCDNCGATTTFDRAEFASECAYCGSNKVLNIEQFEGIKPNALLPFTLTAADARAKWLAWLKKKFFAPRAIKRDASLDHIKGVYSPCWTFDSDTFSHYNGVAGKYYYVTVGSGKNRHTERRIRYFPFSGTIARNFRDVLVEASPHLTDKDMARLNPFPMGNAVAYDRRFLSGFSADHYDKSLQAGWKDGEKIMRGQIQNAIRRSINADVIQSLNVNTSFSNSTFKHVLLPVYVSRATFKEKVYNFFINGINGKVSGKTPVSGGKVALTVGLAVLGVAVAGLLVWLLGN